jgi:hypothetical protein
MAQVAVEHLFTGCARKRPLEIISDAVPGPKGDGTGPRVDFGRREFCDEGVLRIHHAREVTDERLEILFTAAARGCLCDRTESREFFILSARHIVGSVRDRTLLDRLYGGFMRPGHRHLPDDEGFNQSEHRRERSTRPVSRDGRPRVILVSFSRKT